MPPLTKRNFTLEIEEYIVNKTKKELNYRNDLNRIIAPVIKNISRKGLVTIKFNYPILIPVLFKNLSIE